MIGRRQCAVMYSRKRVGRAEGRMATSIEAGHAGYFATSHALALAATPIPAHEVFVTWRRAVAEQVSRG